MANQARDLKRTALRLLTMQTSRIAKAYVYEARQLEQARKEKQPVVLGEELREEFELAVKIMECLFKLSGGTSEVSVSVDKAGEEEMTEEERAAAEALVLRMATK